MSKDEIEEETIKLMMMGKSLQDVVLVNSSKVVQTYKSKLFE
jgi:hypothetical protein